MSGGADIRSRQLDSGGGAFRRAGADPEPLAVHDWAVGPEDLSYMRKRDLVVSLTEHPNREDEPRHSGRVVFGVDTDSLLGGR